MLFAENYLAASLRDGLLDACKHWAKNLRQANRNGSHSDALDLVAVNLGYQNWSQFARAVASFEGLDLLKVATRVGAVLAAEGISFNRAVAEAIMEDYVERNYTPLQHFALYDNESETGYAWPSVDLNDELYEAFSDIFPEELINEVGNRIDADEGPFGIEDYGRDRDLDDE